MSTNNINEVSQGNIYYVSEDCNMSTNDIHDTSQNSISDEFRVSDICSDIIATASKTPSDNRAVLCVSSLSLCMYGKENFNLWKISIIL